MKQILKKILSYKHFTALARLAAAHKVKSFIGAVILVSGAYWGMGAWNGDGGETRYVLAATERGTLAVTVTGSGQVSASDQVDIKAKVSGDAVYIGAKNSDQVKAGTLIIQLDARDALKLVRDAEVNLESAQIALEKIKKPAETLSLIQTQNAFEAAKENLERSYDDGFNAVANAFLELPEVTAGLQDVLYGTSVSAGQSNAAAYSDMVKTYNAAAIQFKADAEIKYAAARNSYDKSFAVYKSAGRFSDDETIKNLISDVYGTTKIAAEAVKSAGNLLSLVKNELDERALIAPVLLAGHQSSLSDYTSKTNSHLNILLNAKDSIVSLERGLTEKNEALEKLRRGADELDLESQTLAVRQKENALKDARDKLADYYIRAPFDGTLTALNLKKSDNVSSGGLVATIITSEKLAEISLNEVDITQIKPGQPAELTFDAVDGLVLAGEVVETDAIGTVSQGVVTYNVKIGFKADDERVKPGMSVTASITTIVKENVLMAPLSAVKTQGRTRYVEVIDEGDLPAYRTGGPAGGEEFLARGAPGIASLLPPRRQPVETGITGETHIEIIGGLNEGDRIVARTVLPSAAAVTPATPSLFGQPGGNRGGVRIPR